MCLKWKFYLCTVIYSSSSWSMKYSTWFILLFNLITWRVNKPQPSNLTFVTPTWSPSLWLPVIAVQGLVQTLSILFCFLAWIGSLRVTRERERERRLLTWDPQPQSHEREREREKAPDMGSTASESQERTHQHLCFALNYVHRYIQHTTFLRLREFDSILIEICFSNVELYIVIILLWIFDNCVLVIWVNVTVHHIVHRNY